MKKTIVVIVMLMVCVIVRARPFLVASPCPTVKVIEPNEVPFGFDANAAPSRLIDWGQIEAGVMRTVEVTACSPKDYECEITVALAPAGLIWDGNDCTWSWQPTNAQVGQHFLSLTVTDKPPAGNPLSETACIVINVTRPANEKPVLLPFSGR